MIYIASCNIGRLKPTGEISVPSTGMRPLEFCYGIIVDPDRQGENELWAEVVVCLGQECVAGTHVDEKSSEFTMEKTVIEYVLTVGPH